MTYADACLIVAGCAGLSASGVRVVGLVSPLETRRRHHETGSAFFMQLGVLFAVLLAFVFSEVWGEYNVASEAINGECGGLHGAALVAHALPPQQSHAVEQALLNYTDAVIHTEWAAMADRHSSPQAIADLSAAIVTVAQLRLSNASDAGNQSQILSLLTQAHAQRETRIFQMAQAVPGALWVILIIYTMVLVACVLFAGVESAGGHMIFAGAFTGCIVMVLVFIKMLDYPFEGALSLGSADFVKTHASIAALLAGA